MTARIFVCNACGGRFADGVVLCVDWGTVSRCRACVDRALQPAHVDFETLTTALLADGPHHASGAS